MTGNSKKCCAAYPGLMRLCLCFLVVPEATKLVALEGCRLSTKGPSRVRYLNDSGCRKEVRKRTSLARSKQKMNASVGETWPRPSWCCVWPAAPLSWLQRQRLGWTRGCMHPHCREREKIHVKAKDAQKILMYEPKIMVDFAKNKKFWNVFRV